MGLGVQASVRHSARVLSVGVLDQHWGPAEALNGT